MKIINSIIEKHKAELTQPYVVGHNYIMSDDLQFLKKLKKIYGGNITKSTDYAHSLDFDMNVLTVRFVAELLQNRKNELNLSYEEIIRRTGIAKHTVYRVMNGSDTYTIESLVKITEALECDIFDLIITK